MKPYKRAMMVGGGIGNLAAAAFLIRDAEMPAADITIYEAGNTLGGSLDAGGNPETGYSFRGGRMFTTDNYECTWDLFRSIPSLVNQEQNVFEETVAFNEMYQSHAKARLVDCRRARVPVESMGFSMENRLELLKLSNADEEEMGDSRISDWLSPSFFETEFWYMWVTTFAFQPWHSAVEFKRYLHRFMKEFSRIETLAGVKRTVYNQYDSLVRPLQHWLEAKGVNVVTSCTITDIRTETARDKIYVKELTALRNGKLESVAVDQDDLVLFQNASMTDASSIGSMQVAPARLNKNDSKGWRLWEQLAKGRPEFGNPAAFNSCIAQSYWQSFTVTLKDRRFIDQMVKFSTNEPGTGGLVTFKDSNWLMSIVIPHQPHFANQPVDVQVFWGYALYPDRIGNFVAKPMVDCNGEEILRELCGHLRFDLDTVQSAICLPCHMPYITSMFMPRVKSDRPVPVPAISGNLAFISQFVEIDNDVVFTVEYSVRAAQIAVYQMMQVLRPVPPISAHDKSVKVQFEAVLKSLK